MLKCCIKAVLERKLRMKASFQRKDEILTLIFKYHIGTVPRIRKRLKLYYYKFTSMVNKFFINYNIFYTHHQNGWSNENVLKNALNI